jgi:hypothetical protein
MKAYNVIVDGYIKCTVAAHNDNPENLQKMIERHFGIEFKEEYIETLTSSNITEIPIKDLKKYHYYEDLNDKAIPLYNLFSILVSPEVMTSSEW